MDTVPARREEATALTLPWSNGQTEGHVNRLKLIKRQMFGRAKFDLLRQRVIENAAGDPPLQHYGRLQRRLGKASRIVRNWSPCQT
jgi:hypothetical protein